MAPLIPGITSQRAKLDGTLRAIADSGARFVGTNILHLDGGTRDHFMKFLTENYPALLKGYKRLYRGKYARSDYANKIQALVNAIQAAHMPRYNRSAKVGVSQQDQLRVKQSSTGAERSMIFGPLLSVSIGCNR